MITLASKFYEEVIKGFPYKPTIKQDLLLNKLADFIFDTNNNALFLLKGYAGTGKTTIISSVVHNLEKANKKAVLLAPTGRAAKVISGYSKKKAFTIHKKIYFSKKQGAGAMSFVKQPNKHSNTIFIVDEASMISDAQQNSKMFENGSLLDDLISYVYSGKNCKLVFIGDTAQLPPVKLTLSPALDADKLSYSFDKNVFEIELDEVVRQQQNSGILANATDLRMLIQYGASDFQFDVKYPDIIRLEDSYDIQDAITSAYDGDVGVEDTAFIVRSNKRANQYNNQIRTEIRGQENEISTGDYVMVVKNNYFWLKESSSAGFIANGDICEVMRINSIKELYGFKFAEVEVRMIDYPDIPNFETVLLLDTLSSESPSLTYEQSNKLYEAVKEDFADQTKYKQFLEVKKNKYFNALQVKFSYAMTCHKSQGGQWNTVFIEQPYLPDGPSVEYLRWLYTAVTRAQNKLYLIGFKDDYFL
ncbi:AAA family ATPase [Tenacibaculum finnmarkense genomovar finnmarkense]|uniref:AAA family ATPase n=2 Tax=Tenacibaculum finnmarkense TaxID=2781243 RepID=A0AAP1WH13_9FLAO|nr:AAA family ATPase [Tenacibaculum finnmarkense]MBE7653647.1 AAA family ATPase [Tenacibaculum finnmarkense genomovar finnmarkense]MBE7661190.1 AAA family ATPase [Tenacibaculum finnmarkense genomovar finnmarkense]MBE7688688.1 AAA family ATPase [Tenacibaculum finnmarkense genomovar ulcerans]MBE7693258.1 AAA family ATPase [Tenacibaculum finnmarkense genomovar finnmarkense]MBE7695961.1 AAA family ATPase [Tenacibaculum finnmarkense genomovar finnmarkense]